MDESSKPRPRDEAATNAVNSGEARARLLQLLVDNISDYAISMLDPKGNILTWSPAPGRDDQGRALCRR